MSTLLKALRRADQSQFTPHMPLMGLPVSQEEEPGRRWIWWLLTPLALLMGAAANYGWHLYHLKPLEQQIEVKEVVTPPFVRVEPRSMVTRPLPPPLPEPVVQPRPVAAAPAEATAGNGPQSLAERIMMALNNTPLVEEGAPQAQPQSGAMPLSSLDPALKQQVPPLTYGAHNFSSDPAKRAVVINGRELREGSEVAPGVLLVAIAQDYIILQVGGQHVSLKALQDWRG
ncbi:GspB family T2SS assembly factor variant ExeB [Aeromonas media]|uniref:General secretion pathway protein GspB n=2 Tax=Aeromonas media TaxID=651 RepID=A0AAE7DQ15_AERME|nr:GspB family T2SS assembly factor variant ExeB [Aeromonas media]MBS4638603.1 GspB family T2SS assembly factor variant ExeB [Aeromonas media]QJT29267.1 general secretion pathway protein GspB [Aeromonas media]QJT36118.1 general secretion pathway protein GspB [Aeromonas media]QJT37947.1 general secretion pathway protein GspB [Aeromonas media]